MRKKYFPFPSEDYILPMIQEGHYIEAITLLHVALESDLIDLIIVKTYNENRKAEIQDGTGRFFPVKEREWEQFGFLEALKICFFMDIISDTLFVRLKRFNTTRNKLVHRALKEEFSSLALEKACREGLDLGDILNEIRLELESRRNEST